MFISLNWIKDWVDLSGLDEDKLIQQFTLSCAEVEGVEKKGANISKVVSFFLGNSCEYFRFL